MQLICLSVSHHQAPVELRECLMLSQTQIEAALSPWRSRAAELQPIEELAILSTCNRLELYALLDPHEDQSLDEESLLAPVRTFLEALLGEASAGLRHSMRLYSGVETAQHLFEVAAGLDSIAIGEAQILGQVSAALETGLRSGSARHGLASLFRAALHSGKRVQTETQGGRHPTSLSEIAVQLAEGRLGSLAGKRIVIAGAGRMGELTAAALTARGVDTVRIASRTLQHAVDLARRCGYDALPFERLGEALHEADVLFTALATPQPVFDRALMQAATAGRGIERLTVIDLGVPRNVDPAAGALPGLDRFDVDDLQAFAAQGEAAQGFLARAHEIVAEEFGEFGKLLRVMPLIGELHRKAEDVRRREVERTLHHLPELDPATQEQIEQLSRSLVRKLLHEPTIHLRDETDPENLREYVQVISKMFDLSQQGQSLLLEECAAWPA
jgi:glutamyl-tRNA reductase